jgi:hypothetical protein
MPIRRWATYSVRDHNHPDAFVADVLLYDRLIVPVPPAGDREEYARWVKEGWAPGRLRKVLDQISDLVEEVPWDRRLQERFADSWEAAKAVGRDSYYTTREFLCSQVVAGELVRPVVAYDSEEKFRADVQAEPGRAVQTVVDRLAIAFRHEFLVPDATMNHVERLEKAAELARSANFRRARTRFYEWQESVISRGYSLGQAMTEMKDMLAEYDAALKEAKWKKTLRYGIFVVGLAVPVLKELHTIADEIASRSEIGLKIVEFARGEEKSQHGDLNDLKPAAMLHTSIKELGLRGPRIEQRISARG